MSVVYRARYKLRGKAKKANTNNSDVKLHRRPLFSPSSFGRACKCPVVSRRHIIDDESLAWIVLIPIGLLIHRAIMDYLYMNEFIQNEKFSKCNPSIPHSCYATSEFNLKHQPVLLPYFGSDTPCYLASKYLSTYCR